MERVLSKRILPSLIVQLLCAAVLILAACSSGDSGRVPSAPGPAESVEDVQERVTAIQAEAKRIDAASEAAENAGGLLMKELPHWQFSGLLQKSKPVFLSAVFSEGRMIREETYYLVDEMLVLARIHKWWDVDDPRQAPEPPTRQDFYIDKDRAIRHVSEVASEPPAVRTDDAVHSAGPFLNRSRSIANILLDGDPQTSPSSMESFPEAENSRISQ